MRNLEIPMQPFDVPAGATLTARVWVPRWTEGFQIERVELAAEWLCNLEVIQVLVGANAKFREGPDFRLDARLFTFPGYSISGAWHPRVLSPGTELAIVLFNRTQMLTPVEICFQGRIENKSLTCEHQECQREFLEEEVLLWKNRFLGWEREHYKWEFPLCPHCGLVQRSLPRPGR